MDVALDGVLCGQVMSSNYVSIRMTVAQAKAVIEAAQAELSAAHVCGDITKAELCIGEEGIDAMDKAVRRATRQDNS